MTKRQFLKAGLQGSAALLLGSLLRPATLLASPLVVSAGYLESMTHSYWMKLSYNNGRESRQARRCVGAALRNIGAIRGTGNGARFAPWFDQTLALAYRRALATGKTPGSVFRLVQMLYDDYLYPRLGPASGWVMFGTLLGMLRGRDGTAQGVAAYASYQAYREAALLQKNAYKKGATPEELLELRKRRQTSLNLWRRNLVTMSHTYASRKTSLNPEFVVESEMLDGFDVYVKPTPAPPSKPPRLTFTREGGRLIVAWDGDGVLQHAPNVSGPWEDVAKSSPAAVDLNRPQGFFRALKRPAP